MQTGFGLKARGLRPPVAEFGKVGELFRQCQLEEGKQLEERRKWVEFFLQEEVAESSPRPVLGSVVFFGFFYENHQFFEVSETTKTEDS
jgi:hypothetical protein